MNQNNRWSNILLDIPPALVVYFVALPLCLGIAVGSNAPAFAGLIAGIIGGIVVGLLSGSQLSVSGPAAGLITVVTAGLALLPSFEVFLLAVVLAGGFQLLFGYLKAGAFGDFIPVAVIKGMMAAIGFTLILKQAQHLVGWDHDFEGDESFFQPDGDNTITGLQHAVGSITEGPLLVGLISLGILILWEQKFMKKMSFTKIIPGSLVAVFVGIGFNEIWMNSGSILAIEPEHLVDVPVSGGFESFKSLLVFPDFTAIGDLNVWKTAIIIALIASVETLLGIEAVDKMDPQKRRTPTNKELNAQGIGNILSGMFGGLPITSVVVRSSANVQAGARSKWSSILHGAFLLLSVVFFAPFLNHIPLSVLAAVLVFVGYKLTSIKLYREMYKLGWSQFIPFFVTFIAILFSDLLRGVALGILVGVFFVIRSNFHSAIKIYQDGNNYLLRFDRQVTFLNKTILKQHLQSIPNGAAVLIDTTQCSFIDQDILDIMKDYSVAVVDKKIEVSLKPVPAGKTQFLTMFSTTF